MEIDSTRRALDAARRKILQLQIEEQALKKETDPLSQARREEIARELSALKEKFEPMRAHGENEKQAIHAIRAIKQRIEETQNAMAEAERKGDLGLAAELKYGQLPALQKELDGANKRLAELQQRQKMLKEEVDAEDVAEVVSKWTRIPVSRLLGAEGQKLGPMG